MRLHLLEGTSRVLYTKFVIYFLSKQKHLKNMLYILTDVFSDSLAGSAIFR